MTEQLEASEGLRVIGHARLMPVAGCNDAALIETGNLNKKSVHVQLVLHKLSFLRKYLQHVQTHLSLTIHKQTVIVLPELRGKGLGRQIMEEAERHSIKAGYRSLHLSTHDKQGFYSKLGYVSGPTVSGRRKCVANLTTEQVSTLCVCGSVNSIVYALCSFSFCISVCIA